MMNMEERGIRGESKKLQVQDRGGSEEAKGGTLDSRILLSRDK